jgi:hypothetical protein
METTFLGLLPGYDVRAWLTTGGPVLAAIPPGESV